MLPRVLRNGENGVVAAVELVVRLRLESANFTNQASTKSQFILIDLFAMYIEKTACNCFMNAMRYWVRKSVKTSL